MAPTDHTQAAGMPSSEDTCTQGNGRVIVVGGGVRSGKSAFALAYARALGTRRAFIATATSGDAEMAARVDRHRRERGPAFVTVEAPTALVASVSKLVDMDVVVIDCLTLWLSNLLLQDLDDDEVLARVDALAEAIAPRRHHTLVVTNEVGMGVVPPSPLGRRFRDLSGFAHQRLTRMADEVCFAMLGTVLRIKPGPVTLTQPRGESDHGDQGHATR